MILREFYRTRDDGVNLYRTYSDSGYLILQNQTGFEYAEAIDVDGAPYTYTETSTKIQDTDEVEDVSVLRARLEDSETAVKILFGEAE